jgi:hypothetical protein
MASKLFGSYSGGYLRIGAKPVTNFDASIPRQFIQMSINKQNSKWSKIYIFCNRDLVSQNGALVKCDFCIRKDQYTHHLEHEPLKHPCKAVQLHRFLNTNEVNQVSSSVPPLTELIANLSAKSNISFRTISSDHFQNLLRDVFTLGQKNPSASPESCLPQLGRSAFPRQFIKMSNSIYDRTIAEYARTKGSALCVDGGKHKTRPYLIVILSNVMHSITPLVVRTVQYFQGKTVDYSQVLLSTCQDLTAKGVSISAIVTDNLRAQVSAIDHHSNSSFQQQSTDPKIRAIIWISCSCHTLALCLNDIRSLTRYGYLVTELQNTVNFLRQKNIVNMIKRTCPISSPTRWTGLFDCAYWILNNYSFILKAILSSLTRPVAYDFPLKIIDGITINAFELFIILLPFKLASDKLEAERLAAAYVIPILRGAQKMSRALILKYINDDDLSNIIDEAIDKRFSLSESGQILHFLYYLTPAGRDEIRNDSSSHLIIHGDLTKHSTTVNTDLAPNIFQTAFIEKYDRDAAYFFREKCMINDAFVQYSGNLLVVNTGLKTKHQSDNEMNPPEINDLVDADPVEVVNRENQEMNFLRPQYQDVISPDYVYTEEEENAETEGSDTEEDSDWVLSEVSGTDTLGPLENSARIIEWIGTQSGRSTEEIDGLIKYFISWITGDPRTTIISSSRLKDGLLYWEYMCSVPTHQKYADFILPLLSIPASEAIVERAFWLQRRIIGDHSMGMSSALEHAKLNMALIEREK